MSPARYELESFIFMVLNVVSASKVKIKLVGDCQLCLINLHCHHFYHQREPAMAFDGGEFCVLVLRPAVLLIWEDN